MHVVDEKRRSGNYPGTARSSAVNVMKRHFTAPETPATTHAALNEAKDRETLSFQSGATPDRQRSHLWCPSQAGVSTPTVPVVPQTGTPRTRRPGPSLSPDPAGGTEIRVASYIPQLIRFCP